MRPKGSRRGGRGPRSALRSSRRVSGRHFGGSLAGNPWPGSEKGGPSPRLDRFEIAVIGPAPARLLAGKKGDPGQIGTSRAHLVTAPTQPPREHQQVSTVWRPGLPPGHRAYFWGRRPASNENLNVEHERIQIVSSLVDGCARRRPVGSDDLGRTGLWKHCARPPAQIATSLLHNRFPGCIPTAPGGVSAAHAHVRCRVGGRVSKQWGHVDRPSPRQCPSPEMSTSRIRKSGSESEPVWKFRGRF